MIGSIIAFLVYLFILTFLGYLGYKHTKTSEDYLVGGRKIHPMIMALSYGSTFISTSAIVGFGGAAETQTPITIVVRPQHNLAPYSPKPTLHICANLLYHKTVYLSILLMARNVSEYTILTSTKRKSGPQPHQQYQLIEPVLYHKP